MRIFSALCLLLVVSMVSLSAKPTPDSHYKRSGALNAKLNAFYSKLGGAANVTPAEVYQSQAAGYMTGGGVSMRNRVANTHPVHIDLPRFNAGCGGIDIYTGGFSFLQAGELVKVLKDIGGNAIAYSFLLGLETVSPQIANTMKQLQTWSNNINSIGINSCETASGLVGSVWPRNTHAKEHLCQTYGSQEGVFSDFIKGRQGCNEPSRYSTVRSKINKDPRFDGVLRDDYNLAWEAINTMEAFDGETHTKELFMSLVGTIIFRGDQKVEVKPSKISDPNFLRAVLLGGDTTLYACEKDGKERCLVVEPKAVTIEPKNSWIEKVRVELLAIQAKILSDEELTEDQKNLLQKSSLPLYKIVNVLTAYKHGACPVDLYQVADIVAMDLMAQYLRDVINFVRDGASQLKRAQLFAHEIDDYLAELGRVERTVKYYETRAMQRMQREFQLMQKLEILEKQIAEEIVF